MLQISNEARALLRSEVGGRLGAIEQLIDVSRVKAADGLAEGEDLLLVSNPQGFSVELEIDRCLDIGRASAANLPISWISGCGRVASARTSSLGSDWVRSFGGGLLTTCGMLATGIPSVDMGREFGLHGRVGALPSSNVVAELVMNAGRTCEELECCDWWSRLSLRVRGEVVEYSLGGEWLRLQRELRFALDRPLIEIIDTVTNDGFESVEHMFRHHINLGYPLVQEGTTVSSNAVFLGVRESSPSAIDVLPVQLREEPAPEGVSYFLPPSDGSACVVNVEAAEVGKVRVSFDSEDWKILILWRDPSPGRNVLAVEPSTSRDGGRADARVQGELVHLDPGESRTYRTLIERC